VRSRARHEPDVERIDGETERDERERRDERTVE
jgi:hypothetical protein